jgi:hypothetical protein
MIFSYFSHFYKKKRLHNISQRGCNETSKDQRKIKKKYQSRWCECEWEKWEKNCAEIDHKSRLKTLHVVVLVSQLLTSIRVDFAI